MLSSVDGNLNLIRHYKFTFFDLVGDGPFNIQEVPNLFIQDSFNFSFSYTVTNSLLNNCKFLFYNLSQETIGLFVSQQHRRGFVFNAWYGNDVKGDTTIFKGLTYTTNTYRQGADIITEIVGCDLFLNLMFKGIFETFPPGTSCLQVVKTLLSKYGNIVTLNAISEQYLAVKVYQSQKTLRGQLNTILQQIASDCGLIYSFQLNSVTMVPSDLSGYTPNAVQTINARNGLVGYVRAEALSIQLLPVTFFTEQALNKNVSLKSCTTLLRPYGLYSKIYLQTEGGAFDGYYGILSLTQSGEWRGNPWYSTMKLWPDKTPDAPTLTT